VAKDNPFDPDKGAAEFRFLLTDAAGVGLKVYTLDGQEVFAREYPGQSAVESGDSFARVVWDGRNNSGDIVRNGVYVVVLTGKKNLEQATIKLAVIR
jgi:flagellar hook assembly protein FlgD